MNYFLWPNDGLRSVPGNPRLDPGVHTNLIKSRGAQLEDLRLRIVNELDVPPASRDAVTASISVLPGTGQLIVTDRYVDVLRLRTRMRNLTITPDGPLPKMLHMKKAKGRNIPPQWHLAKIHKPAGLTGAGSAIGVIDTGCNSTWPDLVAPFAPQFADYQPAIPAQGGKPYEPEKMVPTPTRKDYGSHGSTVCAFLAGNISGVAPGATLHVAALPVGLPLDNQTMVVVGLNWLESVGCDVITTSVFTGTHGQIPQGPLGPGATLEGVEYALEQARTTHKTVVTAAIGNTGALGKFQHAGLSSNAIGVGAVDYSSHLFGSAWGSAAGVFKPDIVAPGYDLLVPISSTAFDPVGGTSFATPIVAGAIALILERDPTLRGDPAGIVAKLKTLVSPVPSSPPPNSTGAGLLNLSTL